MRKRPAKPYINIKWLIGFRNGFVVLTAAFAILWLFDALNKPLIDIDSNVFEPLITVLGIAIVGFLSWIIGNSSIIERQIPKISSGLDK